MTPPRLRRRAEGVCAARPLPTPVLAFAVKPLRRRRDGDRQPQPARDNGYKVYLADGASWSRRTTSRSTPRSRRSASSRSPARPPPQGPRGGDRRRYLDAVDGLVDAVPATSRSSTRRCTASAGYAVGGCSGLGFAHLRRRARAARPRLPDCRVPNPEGRARWTWRSRSPARAPTSWSPTTLTPTVPAAVRPERLGDARGNEVGGLLAHPSWRRATMAPTPAWSRRRLLGKQAAAAGGATPRRSPASNGSAGSRLAFGYEEALGYSVDPAACGTRTASRPCCCSAPSPPRPRPRAAHSSTSSTTSPWPTGCTRPTSSRYGSPTR